MATGIEKESAERERWLGLLSDEARADVMKVQIAETETTKRKQLEEHEKSLRALYVTEGYHAVRFCAVAVVLAFVVVAGITASNAMDAWREVHVPHPAAPAAAAHP